MTGKVKEKPLSPYATYLVDERLHEQVEAVFGNDRLLNIIVKYVGQRIDDVVEKRALLLVGNVSRDGG